MAGKEKNKHVLEFLESGIYRFPASSTFFIDPVRTLNRNYTQFRVSPSSYYPRFFTEEQQQNHDEGVQEDKCSSRKRKRNQKNKKKHQCYTLNEKELLADQRHQEIRPLLVKAHEELLKVKELLDVMCELQCEDEGWERCVDLDCGGIKEEEVSFFELGKVWQAPLYEIALDFAQANKHVIENGADSDCGFNFIMVDPPWENRSAYQKSKYPTLPNRHFLSLPIKQLTHTSGALVALWVTNREKLRKFVEDELFPAWGVRYAATLYWLKVKANGSLICDLDLFHHRPYECLLLGYTGSHGIESELLSVSNLKDQVVITIPGDYSRKPPVEELLLEYVPGSKPARCLELFAREMMGGWTSWGNEPLHFQEKRYFSRKITNGKCTN
ncbi:hypothetical protein BVRB_7g168950 isoform A [Beta vulgaris subsp. vulgaris]|uniref:methyltransferase-like protein 2 isoform X2 n=1 Tax=Beta vulgaris subsp. vulgaris TaxID=3555 RepID=UPI00054034AB|nr:methyltransferase-like protein 2 isoform X2 [Beta vulgaris subsp. vulgaris]KMT04713.1 hypothetical protein BVRB_7g168950 isoform A [Beta vulgaris subsp. vulgaris]